MILVTGVNGRLGRKTVETLLAQLSPSKIYNVSGKPIIYQELAAIASPILGRAIAVQAIDDAEFEARTAQAGLPPPVATLVASIMTGIREGALDLESDDLPGLIGRPQTPLSEALARALRT